MTGFATLPKQSLSAAFIAANVPLTQFPEAATTTITTTVASASTEARVSYQLFQSSSMRWPLSKARPALRKSQCVDRTCLCQQNAMLRFVARVLIARQHDLCGTRCWAATMTLAHPTGNRTCGEFGFKLSLWCFTFLNYTKSTKYEALEKNAVSRQQIA